MYGTLTHGYRYNDSLSQAIHDMVVYGHEWITGFTFKIGKKKIKKKMAEFTAYMLKHDLPLQWFCNKAASWLADYIEEQDQPTFTNPFHVLKDYKTNHLPMGFSPVFKRLADI